MTATYDSIATTTLGSAASSITFSSIPGTYTDLRLVFVFASAGAPTFGQSAAITFNSSTTGYSRTTLTGNGTSATSGRTTSTNQIGITSSEVFANPSLVTIDVFSYAGNTNKTCLVTSNNDRNGSGTVMYEVGLWQNTSAITSIQINNAGSGVDFATGTTATLYGIKSEV